jgi:hypothetical protein
MFGVLFDVLGHELGSSFAETSLPTRFGSLDPKVLGQHSWLVNARSELSRHHRYFERGFSFYLILHVNHNMVLRMTAAFLLLLRAGIAAHAVSIAEQPVHTDVAFWR